MYKTGPACEERAPLGTGGLLPAEGAAARARAFAARRPTAARVLPAGRAAPLQTVPPILPAASRT